MSNYPDLHTPEIADLSRWARDNTPRAAMFLFPDAGHQLYPGIFRVDASRAVYVDWKSGGQVNYLKDFAEEWRTRWEHRKSHRLRRRRHPAVSQPGRRLPGSAAEHRLAGIEPVYWNSQYAVYRIT